MVVYVMVIIEITTNPRKALTPLRADKYILQGIITSDVPLIKETEEQKGRALECRVSIAKGFFCYLLP